MTKKKQAKAKGIYRDGNKLVIKEGARFPSRCAICNKECDGEPRGFTFNREPKSHYIEVAVVQSVARAAADFVKGSNYTGPVEAVIPLCSWHRNRRLRRIGIGVGMFLPAVLILLVRYQIVGRNEFSLSQISAYSIIAIVVAFVGIAAALSALVDSTKVWFKPVKYYDRFVWIEGAGREFLRELPKIEGHHYNPESDDPNLSADELIRRAGLDNDD
jgi:hypothetical protein